MRLLIIGSGAREHALAWKLSQSPRVESVLVAPGNPGARAHGEVSPVDLENTANVVALAEERQVDLVLVGPEAPLVLGVVDDLRCKGIAAFGPSKAAARLEGSKGFAKDFMTRHAIPTANYARFSDAERAHHWLRGRKTDAVVVKADGLAAGKGVYVCDHADEAHEAVDALMKRELFGSAGKEVVIEERLRGRELSYHVITDGTRWRTLPAAKDHKRAYEGDRGPNTGGMGAYASQSDPSEALARRIEETIVAPTIRGMREEGHPLSGTVFIGLMLVDDQPYVLEYNLRFGDPEATVILPMISEDLFPSLLQCAQGALEVSSRFSCSSRSSCSIVLTSGGYPGEYATGLPIDGLDEEVPDGVHVFHAGTRLEGNDTVTAGGRVLAVNAVDDNLERAIRHAYAHAERLHFPHVHFRRDIGGKR